MVNDLIYIAYMDPMGNGVPVPNRWTVYFHGDKGKSENQWMMTGGLALFQDTPVAIQITVISLLRQGFNHNMGGAKSTLE